MKMDSDEDVKLTDTNAGKLFSFDGTFGADANVIAH